MTDKHEEIRILMIEDDEDDYFITRRMLEKARNTNYVLTRVATYEEGLEALSQNHHDVCLADYRLGARNGLELLRAAKEQNAATPIILLTGQGDLEVDLGAMSAGAADYLVKDQINTAVLERSIRYAVERRRTARRIRRQAALLDEAHDAISTHDLEGHVQYWNRSAERLTGYAADEMEGRTMHFLIKGEASNNDQDVLHRALDAVLHEEEWSGELTLQARDESKVIVESRWSLVRDDTGQPESILVINNDITERKDLETQFMRSQRMESIGRLVGGIAHDLGNLLMPIGLGVQTLRARLEDDEDALRTLDMIKKSAERGSEMVRQVLAFARGVEGDHTLISVQSVCEEIETMIAETLPEDMDLHVSVTDDCCDVVADATQIQQVLMNLCVNARHAMGEQGTLKLQVENCRVDEGEKERILESEAGNYVCITVSDTGPGIPPDVLDKIFEPFFTTKTAGKGTGLGLSTVYSVVKSHDGFVNVQSERGQGATFEVYLPQAQKEATVIEDRDLPELQQGNGETVLVIDDEAHVRNVLAKVLQENGYCPVLAENGAEALQVAAERGGDIAVVIADLMMPGMDGRQVIQKLTDEHLSCPILVSSGLSGNRPDHAIESGADEILSKPYSAETLCRTLQDLLQEAQQYAAANEQTVSA